MEKRKILCFLFVLFLFRSPLEGGELVQTLQEVFPGDPLPFRLYTDPSVRDVEVFLWREEDRNTLLAKGKAFRVPDEGGPGEGVPGEGGEGLRGATLEDTSTLWVGLLGIPSVAPAGLYRLEIRMGERSLVFPVSVLGRQFIHEEIALNREMSKLRTEEDARKIAEMREILERVSVFNPQSMYHPKPFRLPVEGFRRTSQFGDRRKYRYADGGAEQAIHTGIDFATPRGNPVHLAASGQVAFAGPRILTGNTVVVEHLPGVYSLYYHLDRIEVKEGDRLHEGDRIGTTGATGLVTGPHLHWEVRVGGIPVNPDAFLRAGPLDKFFQLRETAVTSKEGR